MANEILQDEISLDRLISTLSITIKHDDVNKVIVFLAMLLAQTEDSQVNVILSNQSCAGKSYILQSVADFFPAEEILVFGNASPTALIHRSPTKLRYKVKDKWHYVNDNEKIPKGKQCQRIIDLAHKILIFLDQPNPELLTRIRPVLSHDSKETNFSIVDKTKSGSMRTMDNVIIGFPAVFFATVSPSMDMQEATRAIILSPEISAEKTEQALDLVFLKDGLREQYVEILNDPNRLALKNLVKDIRASGIREVRFNAEDLEYLRGKFDVNNPRVTRDAQKILSLAKAWALLNFRNREKVNAITIKGTKADFETAFRIYEPVLEANTLGIRPEIWDFFQQILKPAPYPLSAVQIQEQYLVHFKRGIGLDDVKRYCKVLEEKGLVVTERSQADARVIMYSAVKRSEAGSLE